MTAAEMDIVIGAEVNGAVNGLKQVQTQLSKTEQTASQVTTKTSKNFTGLTRVIQDLPFGFVAISNNLEQLLPAAGAAGLAISAITAAITFAQVGFTAWTRGIQSAKEGADEFAKAGANVQTELTKMVALVNVARDLTENTDTRTNAIKELQKEYPGYLGNLTLENVGSQETAFAVQMLSDALQRKAKVQALSNLLTQAEEKLIKAQGETVGDNLLTWKSFFSLFKSGTALSGAAGTMSLIGSAAGQTTDNISDAEKAVNELSKALSDLTREQAVQNDFELLSPTALKKIKEIKEFKMPAVKFDIHAGRVTPLQDHSFDTINKEIGDFLANHPLKPIVTLQPNLVLGEQAKKAIDATLGLINDQIKSGFSAIGESLGNALAGAKNPFAPILAVLAEGLKTLGKAYIEIGVEALIAKKALSLLMKSPALTIAAGIALVALGSLLQNKANNVKAFATGGVVTQPTLALVGEQGPERITPLGYEGRANNMMQGEVIFQISGQNLRGILRRADQTAFNTF